MKLSMLVSAGLAAAFAAACSGGGGGRDGAGDGVDAPPDGEVADDGDAFDQPDEALHGSMRMTIARNRVESGTYGLLLGRDDGIYPYAGIKDLVVRGNLLQVTEDAILLDGDSSETNRFRVCQNGGSAVYTQPELIEGDVWSGNADGVTFGSPTDVAWSAESFDWEACDVN
jgi:hypothetical protein